MLFCLRMCPLNMCSATYFRTDFCILRCIWFFFRGRKKEHFVSYLCCVRLVTNPIIYWQHHFFWQVESRRTALCSSYDFRHWRDKQQLYASPRYFFGLQNIWFLPECSSLCKSILGSDEWTRGRHKDLLQTFIGACSNRRHILNFNHRHRKNSGTFSYTCG